MMKKYVLLFFILVFVQQAHAQFEIKKIAGKWQETNREEKKNKSIPFNDTLRLEIRPEGFVMVRYDVGATFFGDADVRGKYFTVKDHSFEYKEFDEDNLTLIDDKGIHYFKKATEFTSSPVATKLIVEQNNEINLSYSNLQGKWICYKKTDPNYDILKFYLKSIYFNQEKEKTTLLGEVSLSNANTTTHADAIFYIKENTILISTDNETFAIKITKASPTEIIASNGSATFYLKQIGKKE